MFGILKGIQASQGAAFEGLFDATAEAATGFSLRRLGSSYTGSLIRVRESGGDTEADIGYTSSGDLDQVALLAHTGSNNGFITKWYDQVGLLDAVQAVNANQPQIVSSGTIITSGSIAAIDFLSGTQTWLEIPTSTTSFKYLMDGTTSFTSNVLETDTDVAGFQVPWSNNTTGSTDVGADLFILSTQWYQYGRNAVAAQRMQNIGGIPIANTQYLITEYWDMDNATPADKNEIYINAAAAIKNNTRATAATSSASTNNMRIGNAGTGTVGFKGNQQELVFWDTDQTSNKAVIESNTNDYYSIY